MIEELCAQYQAEPTKELERQIIALVCGFYDKLQSFYEKYKSPPFYNPWSFRIKGTETIRRISDKEIALDYRILSLGKEFGSREYLLFDSFDKLEYFREEIKGRRAKELTESRNDLARRLKEVEDELEFLNEPDS